MFLFDLHPHYRINIYILILIFIPIIIISPSIFISIITFLHHFLPHHPLSFSLPSLTGMTLLSMSS